jgi:hypothetical protein
MAGVAGLSKDMQAGLQKSLASQSAPPNPQTPTNPTDRKDPGEATFIDLQRVRRASEVAASHMDESDPQVLLLSGINACMTRLLSSISLSDAVDVLLERLFPLASPQLKARLAAMFTPISPPVGPAGGAQGLGQPPGPNQGPAGGATGQPPGGGQPPMPGDASPPLA